MKKLAVFLAALFWLAVSCPGIIAEENKQSTETVEPALRLFEDGRVYAGQMVDGKPNGFGFYHDPNNEGTGYFYCGYWKDNVRDGYGVLYTSNGERYAGTFVNNAFNSSFAKPLADRRLMKKQFSDGSWMLLEFAATGEPNGCGAIFFSDGSYYIGEFLGEAFNGYGMFCSPESSEWHIGIFESQSFSDILNIKKGTTDARIKKENSMEAIRSSLVPSVYVLR